MAKVLNDSYLDLLVEECGEVLQAVGKCRRFGLEHFWFKEGKPNFVALAHELGGLLEIIDRLGLPSALIIDGRIEKIKRLKIYGPDVWTPAVGDELAKKEYGS